MTIESLHQGHAGSCCSELQKSFLPIASFLEMLLADQRWGRRVSTVPWTCISVLAEEPNTALLLMVTSAPQVSSE